MYTSCSHLETIFQEHLVKSEGFLRGGGIWLSKLGGVGMLLASSAKYAAKHFLMHRSVPTAKNYLAQHVNNEEAEKY